MEYTVNAGHDGTFTMRHSGEKSLGRMKTIPARTAVDLTCIYKLAL